MKKTPFDYLLQYLGLIIFALALVIVFVAMAVYYVPAPSGDDVSNTTARFMDIFSRFGLPFVAGTIFTLLIVSNSSKKRKHKTLEDMLKALDRE